VVAALRRRGPRIDLLINDSVLLHPRGGTLRVVGADFPQDPRGRHSLPHAQEDATLRAFADQAFSDAKPGETVLALSHHPDFFPFAASHGAALTLAGHHHGGQVRLFGRPLRAYAYLHGPYRLGDAHLDVTAGVGHWLPVRIGVPREIVIVTLRG
jgi:predicted MPP superfamily phosphohydrolase